MGYPPYLRQRARELRVANHLSVDELAERLSLPRTTIYHWVKDLPLGRPRSSTGQQKGTAAMQAKYRRLREEAYERGLAEYDELQSLPTFRDFVVLYIAEGYKRDRNTLSITNSDPVVIALSAGWLERLSGRVPSVRIQYHADQDTEELRLFWAAKLGVEPAAIRFHPKTNSSQLRTRTWRCVYGVVAVAVHDTLLRARLQAWIDRVFETWG
jgi:transposase-like protein